ncbi:bromodomain and PHD finger-containing protein [Microdochium trichocladiopsis]|uniref:Bromodomain and PHD finger-containing protein n=1 Tax=Microdochium trichocladiopsis TaxID=1682393 RepID=A0A9P8YH76_9PEZI|nr:bromodomain and PHD finger-containing protein [Microdochium trichocladiopsis]KAH7038085.1 bromodomain and PHD finger-containing protein [Microdochium trichocladiopsis]
MIPSPRTPRQSTIARPSRARQRPSPATANNFAADSSIIAATEPPLKRRRYTPSGPEPASALQDKENDDIPATVGATNGRTRQRQSMMAGATASPSLYPRRERSTRIRTSTRHADQDDEIQISSAAAVAAAVVQSEGYKPREERGWEEFHPNLDIESTFMIYHADDVDGTVRSAPPTPSASRTTSDLNIVNNSIASPSKDPAVANLASASDTPTTDSVSTPLGQGLLPGTPTRSRRNVRPPRDSFYPRPELTSGPKVPTVLPIHNQTPKERLDLKLPSYRKTDRILLFESKKFGQARYVDKAMMNVGYQESDNYICPDRRLITASDANLEDESESMAISQAEVESVSQHSGIFLGRVEYDMDEQDDMWLEAYNVHRKSQGWNPVTREVFEITITKIEKEWHALEKRIPKPNPKPPQTHRPRSSSAAAVNGEPQAGEEQDSKCAICDDGDCENTNAIVFCDGCDLAVHQECYGVPFIPEGQWLCRKCQLIGRGVPTCIFCPNSDGAFKQTNSSKWAHLLCAMWIPEVTLGNHTFMEPVMDVDKVPKSRWKLTCYICQQQMGACIQCGNKSCYQAFHVTCARRARLFLRMKNASGALDVLDGSTNLKALCDKHCPTEYSKENDVIRATRRAKKYYKRTMRDRIWATNQASAIALAATHRNAITDHPPDESQMTGAKMSAALGDKNAQPGKPIWKLPSGAPVIPQAVFEVVETSLQRFNFLKRREFVSDACRYWTLKREMRRGAALLKRLQLQMETFSSMELTRRNFAAMGPVGKARLNRRIEFAQALINDLEQLRNLSNQVVQREQQKLEAAELEQDFIDTCYFPVHRMLSPVVEKALSLDKKLFETSLVGLQNKVDERYYTATLAFVHDLCDVINTVINSEPKPVTQPQPKLESVVAPVRHDFSDIRDRKRLGKRILKSVQPQLESALRIEADATHKTFDTLKIELESLLESSLEVRPSKQTNSAQQGEPGVSQDVIMVDSSAAEITVGGEASDDGATTDIAMVDADGEVDEDRNIEVATSGNDGTEPHTVLRGKRRTADKKAESSDIEPVDTPPATNGYVTAPASVQPGPPTPPQSNGSFGRHFTESLAEGGILWYLKDFEPSGTTAVPEPPQPERIAARSPSEALTEMDDDELTGLGAEINEGSITASPAMSNKNAKPVDEGALDDDDEDKAAVITTPSAKSANSPVKKSASKSRKRKVTYRRR